MLCLRLSIQEYLVGGFITWLTVAYVSGPQQPGHVPESFGIGLEPVRESFGTRVEARV